MKIINSIFVFHNWDPSPHPLPLNKLPLEQNQNIENQLDVVVGWTPPVQSFAVFRFAQFNNYFDIVDQVLSIFKFYVFYALLYADTTNFINIFFALLLLHFIPHYIKEKRNISPNVVLYIFVEVKYLHFPFHVLYIHT